MTGANSLVALAVAALRGLCFALILASASGSARADFAANGTGYYGGWPVTHAPTAEGACAMQNAFDSTGFGYCASRYYWRLESGGVCKNYPTPAFTSQDGCHAELQVEDCSVTSCVSNRTGTGSGGYVDAWAVSYGSGGGEPTSMTFPQVFELSPEDGAQIGFAIAGLWALAFCFRALVSALNTDSRPEREEES